MSKEVSRKLQQMLFGISFHPRPTAINFGLASSSTVAVAHELGAGLGVQLTSHLNVKQNLDWTMMCQNHWIYYYSEKDHWIWGSEFHDIPVSHMHLNIGLRHQGQKMNNAFQMFQLTTSYLLPWSNTIGNDQGRESDCQVAFLHS